jgi:sulfoxide reductase heme-binding subunit YedZ
LLHRLIYASAIAGVIHYLWQVKSDKTIPLRYAAVVTVLLLYRIVARFLDRPNKPAAPREKEAVAAS